MSITKAQRSPTIPGDPLLTELMADYSERHALTLRSPATAQFHAYRIGKWIEGRRASEAREVAAKIRDDLLAAYAPATVNRSLGALKKALALAWEQNRTPVDYSSLIKRVAENNARTTFLSMRQVQTLAQHASEQVQAAIWISLFTGCRRGEILALRPEDIGRDTITIQAGNTKTLRTRTVPIIPPARPWLKAIPLQINFEGLKSGFRRAREAAGMPDVTFHDLRRSCGTLLIQKGVELHVVSRLLGHTSTTVTEKVYAHLHDRQLKQGLGALTDLHRAMNARKKRRAA
ncbi:tyrosine-type recombinase/integrase [Methylibium sp.]|uniref:tyrosine-type recombinase/integrase n=1 Tax=Methylibium sp. TaxID=2067992 RepID=UPI003D0F3219